MKVTGTVCKDKVEKRNKEGSVAHHLVLLAVKRNPLQLPMAMYLKENSGGKTKRYSMLLIKPS